LSVVPALLFSLRLGSGFSRLSSHLLPQNIGFKFQIATNQLLGEHYFPFVFAYQTFPTKGTYLFLIIGS
jgi:hypothetical protein